ALRSLHSSGEPVVPATMRAFAEMLGLSERVLHTAWGMTEACFATYSHEGPDRLKPVPGVDVRVDADGNLEIRGALVSGSGERTEDGWLRTGDLATIRDGVLAITGRAKEMIKAGGAAFAPGEIEAAA